MRTSILFPFLITCLCGCFYSNLHAQVIHFVFTSDVHYGITRPHFRGVDSVPADIVNANAVAAINTLATQNFPKDDGLEAGAPVRYIDDIIVTGDIANREEISVQPATVSWQAFLHDYQKGIHTHTANGQHTGLLLTPGNHDVSNAIGYTKPMLPLRDAGSMAGMYTMMMGKKINPAVFDFKKDKINYVRTFAGVHLLFISIWPDSVNRVWMEKQLAAINDKEPVLIFAHDPPEADPKHFTNPNGSHNINATDQFENVLEETYKSAGKSTDQEQKGWIDFLQKHPNIKAYFHGHSNFNEWYTYTGPQHTLSLPVFRADSPMKGKFSREDETLLSFDVISINSASHTMTVRNCLWNKDEGKTLQWGKQCTIKL